MTEDDLEAGTAPNCPRDLIVMVLEGEGDRMRWRCPECEFARL